VDESLSPDSDPQGEVALDDGGEEARNVTGAIPAVVAVVVTRDPGPWFEEALGALVAQEYPNLSILVVDNASAADPTPRIAAVAPRAYVRRLTEDRGFGAAVNTAMAMVEGAPFFLICHDDVAPAPNAVGLLVEEAYRSNAGVVGAKLVRWDDAGALLSVGMGADRFGSPFPLCERGELDQEQHDAVRDVFFVPAACALVRADLLRALGGFDEDITYHGEDTDLCWRAHLAGARVLVAPAARARHVEALGERRPDDRRRLQLRHRLRMVCTNYGWFYLIGELVQQAALSVLELVAALVVGRFGQARDLVGAWTWNLSHLPSVLAKRRRVRAQRQITDLELRRLQARGSARLTGFVRGQVGEHDTTASLGDAVRQWLARRGAAAQRQNVVIAVVVAVLLVFGSRHLITRSVPAIGEFVPFPDRARDVLSSGWSGWIEAGLGAAGPGATGVWLIGLAGVALMGATGLLRTLLVLGCIPVGLVGLWRLGSFTPHGRAKGAMLLAYVANPLPYNALTSGRWTALGLYGLLPWIVRAMAAVSGSDPYGPPSRRSFVHGSAVIALSTAALVTLSPVTALIVVGTAVAFASGSVLAGAARQVPRLLAGTVAGVVIGLALHLPWLWTAWSNDDPDVHTLGGVGGAAGHRLGELVHFYSGRLGGAWVTWGLLLAGLIGLAIGRSWRLGWAVRGWSMFALPMLVVAVVQAGWLDLSLPAAEVLLAPAALGVALAVGTGMAAFDLDLRGYRFGWRQVASVVAAAALVASVLPVVLLAFDGRWKMARGGYDRVLGFVDGEAADLGPFRVLWLGADDMLPVSGWPLGDGVTTFATTVGYPSLSAMWSGPLTDATRTIPAAFEQARLGGDNRLGQQLGVMAVRYVVVVDRLAPTPFDGPERPAATWLDATLSSQLDLARIDLNGAMRVYRNTAWLPMVDTVDAGATTPAELPFPDSGAPPTPALTAVAARQFEGELAAGDVVHLAQSFDPAWELQIDGGSARSGTGFGYANRFEVAAGGPATLRFASPAAGRWRWAVQLVAWLVVLGVALRTAGSGRRRSRDDAPEPAAPSGTATSARNVPAASTGAAGTDPADGGRSRPEPVRSPAAEDEPSWVPPDLREDRAAAESRPDGSRPDGSVGVGEEGA